MELSFMLGSHVGLQASSAFPELRLSSVSRLNDVNYSSHHEPAAFDDWLQTLRDKVGQRQILARLTRLSLGNWGLHASWRRGG